MEMAMAQRDPEEYTYADYLSWAEADRIQIIDGEAVVMQAAPSRKHQQVLTNLMLQLGNYLAGKNCKVYPAPFAVTLDEEGLPDDEIKTVVEPDITVICDPSKLTERGCSGAPDMIVEILSPTTARIDQIIKFNKYLQCGVKEYWIVDPETKVVLTYLLQNGKYVASAYGESRKVKVQVLSDCLIDLSKIFE